MSEAAITQVVEKGVTKFRHQPPVRIRDTITDVIPDHINDGDKFIRAMVHGGAGRMFGDWFSYSGVITRWLW